MMIDKKVIKFKGEKVKEVDRQYEANNNAELDNGVYHQDDEEENKEEETKKQQPQQHHLDDESLQREIEQDQKQRK